MVRHMSRATTYPETLTFKVPGAVKAMIASEAARNYCNEAEICRRLLLEGLRARGLLDADGAPSTPAAAPKPQKRSERRNDITRAIEALMQGPVGESAFLPFPKTNSISGYIWNAAARQGCKPSGWYTAKRVEGGVRIWKLSEPTYVRAAA